MPTSFINLNFTFYILPKGSPGPSLAPPPPPPWASSQVGKQYQAKIAGWHRDS